MNGASIKVSGDLRSGGARLVLKTTHEQQGDPLFFRLNPGVSPARLLAAVKAGGGQDPNLLNPLGSIVVDAEADRGTTVVQANLAAAQYVAVDTANPNTAKNPITVFTIRRAVNPPRLPAANAYVTAIEFNFRGPGTLHDGWLVRFQNGGFLVHMIIGAKASSLANAKKLHGHPGRARARHARHGAHLQHREVMEN